jgi:hypothetical protein
MGNREYKQQQAGRQAWLQRSKRGDLLFEPRYGQATHLADRGDSRPVSWDRDEESVDTGFGPITDSPSGMTLSGPSTKWRIATGDGVGGAKGRGIVNRCSSEYYEAGRGVMTPNSR